MDSEGAERAKSDLVRHRAHSLLELSMGTAVLDALPTRRGPPALM